MNSLRALLALLLAFLTLGHSAPPGEDPPADPPADPPTDPIEDLDLEDEDPPADPPAPDGDEPEVLRERLARSERELADARRAADEAQRRHSAPPAQNQPSPGERLYAQEEEELRNPRLDPNRRWQIEANRVLRSNQEATQTALRQAQDVSDRTDFSTLCASSPVAKKYSKRVEEKLAEIRGKGGNLDRRVVLKMLVGDDIVEGRVKSKKRDTAGEGAGEVTRVHRGQAPVSRSDVRGRGAATERDKRRARLEGKTI